MSGRERRCSSMVVETFARSMPLSSLLPTAMISGDGDSLMGIPWLCCLHRHDGVRRTCTWHGSGRCPNGVRGLKLCMSAACLGTAAFNTGDCYQNTLLTLLGLPGFFCSLGIGTLAACTVLVFSSLSADIRQVLHINILVAVHDAGLAIVYASKRGLTGTRGDPQYCQPCEA